MPDEIIIKAFKELKILQLEYQQIILVSESREDIMKTIELNEKLILTAS